MTHRKDRSRPSPRAAKLAAVAASMLAGAASLSAARAETLVERGNYLVNAVMACDGCHTPRQGPAFVMERRFAGGSQLWDTPAFRVRGANITPDRDTGIGAWSDADLKRALVDGVRPSGVPMSPQMPFPFYKVLTPHDLDAVVAYVKSVSPVRHEVEAPSYKAAMHVELVPGGEKPMAQDDLRDPVKRGFYLATIAHCMECHSRKPNGEEDFKTWWGKGGFEFRETWGSAVARNITSHPTAGIGAWTDAEIKRALVEGIGRDGRNFKPPMARHIYFKRMTEEDIGAIITWLRTVPPLE